MPNSYVSMTDLDPELAKIQRQQRLADMLQQQAMQDIPTSNAGGIPAPISPFSGLAKILAAYGAKRNMAKADEEMSAYRDKDSASAQALIRQLTQGPNQAGAPDVAPVATQLDPTAPRLPGGAAPMAQAPVPMQVGGAQGTPMTQAQPSMQEQMAALLAARGGPQTQMVQNAMLPQLMNRQNLDYQHQLGREDKTWDAAQPMAVARQQEIDAQAAAQRGTAAAANALPMNAYQSATVQDAQRSAAETARHNRASEFAAEHPFGAGFSGNETGAAFFDQLSKQNPGLANQVKAIANYRQAPPGRGTKQGIALMNLVSQFNPEYDATQYGSKVKSRNDFSTGKNGNTVRSLNVAVQHLDLLGQLSTALGNGDVQLFNKIGQSWTQQTGKPAPTNFDAAKQIVGDEVIKAVIGSGGGVQDREEAAKNIARASSPQQLVGVINTYQGLMGGQLGGLKLQYEKTTGLKDFEDYLAPETRTKLEAPRGGAKSVVRTGTLNGKKVVQYSDGSYDYAN